MQGVTRDQGRGRSVERIPRDRAADAGELHAQLMRPAREGRAEHEAAAVRSEIIITPLSDFFSEDYFQTKKVVYVQL